jgi:hypothetical protein
MYNSTLIWIPLEFCFLYYEVGPLASIVRSRTQATEFNFSFLVVWSTTFHFVDIRKRQNESCLDISRDIEARYS